MNLSGNQWFCLLVVAVLVFGAAAITFAESFGERKRRKHPHRDDDQL